MGRQATALLAVDTGVYVSNPVHLFFGAELRQGPICWFCAVVSWMRVHLDLLALLHGTLCCYTHRPREPDTPC